MNMTDLFRGLKDKDLRQQGIMIGEGTYIVTRMLESDCSMLRILCTPELEARYCALAHGRCPVNVLSTAQLAELTGFPFHRGVLGAARRPTQGTWENFLQQQTSRPPVSRTRIAILPQVQEAENLGSIMRSAAAFGLAGLFLGPGSCDPYSRKVLRCSMGAIFRLPLFTWTDTALFCRQPAHAGYTLIGTTLHPGAGRLAEYTFPANAALVLGNEAAGLDPGWLAACETLLTIPQAPGVDSLNVGVAAGIFFYTACPL